jgi:hypothetical protein
MVAAKLSATSLLMEVDDSDVDFDKGRTSRAFIDEITQNIDVDPRARQYSISRHVCRIPHRLCQFRLRQM